jgi:hypothetical protein
MEMIKEFFEQYRSLPQGQCVAVTQHNRSTFYGLFEDFGDSEELKKQNKWRFVPIHRLEDFYEELQRTNIPNAEHSLIIEGSSISKLELIRPSCYEGN